MMEATVSTSETSANAYQITRRNIPEDSHILLRRFLRDKGGIRTPTETPNRKDHVQICRHILKNSVEISPKQIQEVCKMDYSCTGQRLVVGFCEHGNEPSVSMRDVKFLAQLSKSHFLAH
jgi:hypothetical protein